RFVLHAVDQDIAVTVQNDAGFFEPLIQPLPGCLRPNICQIRSEHRGARNSIETMAPHTIELCQQSTSAIELWRFCCFPSMADTARGLNVSDGKKRLFPSKGGLVSFLDLGGEALAAVADDTAPFVDSVWNGRVGTERLRDRGIQQARLTYTFVAGN